MPDRQITPADPAEREALLDSAILHLLIHENSHRLWAVEEIGREVRRDPTDSLGRLQGGGLIHRLEGFVWAARPAVMIDELDV
jgi:hypothetical protein